MSSQPRSARTLFMAAIMVVVVAVAATLAATQRQVVASEVGPGGCNIAFDFSWNDAGNPPGYSA